jgi:hypothetical protein
LVDGHIVKRGGRLLAYDTPAVMRRARQSAERIRAAAGAAIVLIDFFVAQESKILLPAALTGPIAVELGSLRARH